MKKYILTIICSLTSLFALAQSNVKVKSVHLIDGNVVNFDKATVDSSRVVFTPEGDSLGVKIYVKGQESTDYLYSQISTAILQRTWPRTQRAGDWNSLDSTKAMT